MRGIGIRGVNPGKERVNDCQVRAGHAGNQAVQVVGQNRCRSITVIVGDYRERLCLLGICKGELNQCIQVGKAVNPAAIISGSCNALVQEAGGRCGHVCKTKVQKVLNGEPVTGVR